MSTPTPGNTLDETIDIARTELIIKRILTGELPQNDKDKAEEKAIIEELKKLGYEDDIENFKNQYPNLPKEYDFRGQVSSISFILACAYCNSNNSQTNINDQTTINKKIASFIAPAPIPQKPSYISIQAVFFISLLLAVAITVPIGGVLPLIIGAAAVGAITLGAVIYNGIAYGKWSLDAQKLEDLHTVEKNISQKAQEGLKNSKSPESAPSPSQEHADQKKRSSSLTNLFGIQQEAGNGKGQLRSRAQSFSDLPNAEEKTAPPPEQKKPGDNHASSDSHASRSSGPG